MLGRRTPQMNFFDAASLPHRVAPDSFYGRMGAVAETLFQDDDLKALYDPDYWPAQPAAITDVRRGAVAVLR